MSATHWCFVLALFVCGGCSAVIVPPATPSRDAVPVLVADYGYHSTIILPRTQGGLVEYAFGDWVYFGQNRKSLFTALHALLASDQATLGRRVLYAEPRQAGLESATGANTIIRFDAPRDKVIELERALEERFSAKLDSITYSPVHQLYFVKDDERYRWSNNCNHFTARWLERLGCEVRGIVLGSGFRVAEEPGGRHAAMRPVAAGDGDAHRARSASADLGRSISTRIIQSPCLRTSPAAPGVATRELPRVPAS